MTPPCCQILRFSRLTMAENSGSETRPQLAVAASLAISIAEMIALSCCVPRCALSLAWESFRAGTAPIGAPVSPGAYDCVRESASSEAQQALDAMPSPVLGVAERA
jgi:hypothetical protein